MATVPHSSTPKSDEKLGQVKTFARTGAATMSFIGGKAALTLAGQSGDLLRASGVIAADEARQQGRDIIGRQLSARAASGVDVHSGSSAQIAARDAARAELNALRQKFRFDAAAHRLETSGTIAAARGSGRAFSTLLTDADFSGGT